MSVSDTEMDDLVKAYEEALEPDPNDRVHDHFTDKAIELIEASHV